MGSSSNVHTTVAGYREAPYMDTSEVSQSQLSKLNMALDSQFPQQDDISHDTLMGLQELDSHLAIFDGSNIPGKGPSAASQFSDIASDDFLMLDDVDPTAQLDESDYHDIKLISECTSSPSILGRAKAGTARDLIKYVDSTFP